MQNTNDEDFGYRCSFQELRDSGQRHRIRALSSPQGVRGQVDGVGGRDQLKVIPDERTIGANRRASSWIISAKRSAPTVPVLIAFLTSIAW